MKTSARTARTNVSASSNSTRPCTSATFWHASSRFLNGLRVGRVRSAVLCRTSGFATLIRPERERTDINCDHQPLTAILHTKDHDASTGDSNRPAIAVTRLLRASRIGRRLIRPFRRVVETAFGTAPRIECKQTE
jgi:hypothetical protein